MLNTFYRSQNITTGCFFLLIATVILRVQCTDSFADAGSRKSLLRIRDVYPESRIQLFSILDPGSELSPSRIPDPGSASKNFSILTPPPKKKNKKKMVSKL
jgi:hypothetical protein